MKRKVICAYCHKQFEAKTLKALFCGNTCKSYSQRERKGVLSPTIGNAQSQLIKENEQQKNVKKYSLVFGYLRTKFVNADFDEQDKLFGVERVTINQNNKVILSSCDIDVINTLKDEFNGTAIFETLSEKSIRKDNQGDVNYANLITARHNQEMLETGHSTIVPTKEEYRTWYEHSTVFNTTVELKTILQISKIPINALD
jgi:hypothetical protein